jgi:small conductance mechanosensitive channel
MPVEDSARSLADQLWSYLVGYGLRVAGVILFLVLAWIVAKWLRRLIVRAFAAANVDPTLGKFVANVTRWAIIILVALACLGTFGLETMNFTAVIGAAGLAIGLAFQGSLSNLAAGVMLLVFRPFRVGDLITVAGQNGRVNEIDLFMTELDTPDGRRIVIPNSQIFGNVIENLTYHSTRRIDIAVGVPPTVDAGRMRDVLREAIRRVPGVLERPGPVILIDQMGHAFVNWTVQLWVRRDEYLTLRQRAMDEIRTALEQAGIAGPALSAPVPPLPGPAPASPGQQAPGQAHAPTQPPPIPPPPQHPAPPPR